jgi:hypothetical protein
VHEQRRRRVALVELQRAEQPGQLAAVAPEAFHQRPLLTVQRLQLGPLARGAALALGLGAAEADELGPQRLHLLGQGLGLGAQDVAVGLFGLLPAELRALHALAERRSLGGDRCGQSRGDQQGGRDSHDQSR